MPDVNQKYPVNDPNNLPGRARLGSRYFRVIFGPVQAESAGRIRLRGRATGNEVVVPKYDAGVVVADSGQIYVAPVGTAAPTLVRSVLDPAWNDLGYISDEGFTYSEKAETEPKSSWTSYYPKEFVLTGRNTMVTFALREFNKRAVEFALEGTVSPSGSEWKKTPATSGSVPRALVIDWQDGAKLFRMYIPSGAIQADVESQMTRTGPTDLPLVFAANKMTDDPYTIFLSNELG